MSASERRELTELLAARGLPFVHEHEDGETGTYRRCESPECLAHGLDGVFIRRRAIIDVGPPPDPATDEEAAEWHRAWGQKQDSAAGFVVPMRDHDVRRALAQLRRLSQNEE